MHESNIAIKNEIAKAVANNMQQKLDGGLLPTIDTNINIDLESMKPKNEKVIYIGKLRISIKIR